KESKLNKMQHSTPSSVLKRNLPQTQLYFNNGERRNPSNSYNAIRKPKPIIIEKIIPRFDIGHTNTALSLPSEEELISSKRLSAAVQLAKLDIRKLKSMLTEDRTDTVLEKSLKRSIKKNDYAKKGKPQPEEKSSMKNKRKRNKADDGKGYKLHFYPSSSDVKTDVPSFKPSSPVKDPSKEDQVADLQKELEKYSKSLQQVVSTLHDKGYGGPHRNEKKFRKMNILQQEQEERRWEMKVKRAEEQAKRSGRMLYGLQRKVHDLNRHINKKTFEIKDWKKSEYLESLLAAHKDAVKTLQSFVNHAPLYYDTSGQLPCIYKELGQLLRQLSALSIHKESFVNTSATEDLMLSLTTLDNRKGSIFNHKTYKEDVFSSPLARFHHQPSLKDYEQWMKERAHTMKMQTKKVKEDLDTQTSKSNKNKQFMMAAKPQNVGKSSRPAASKLKKKSIKVQSSKPSNLEKRPTTYSAPTVASRIREKPQISRSSPSKKNIAFEVDTRSFKEKDDDIVEEARDRSRFDDVALKQRSPNYDPRSPPESVLDEPVYCYNEGKQTTRRRVLGSPLPFVEKEVKRQHWLDRLKNHQMQKLNRMGKENLENFEQLRQEFEASKYLISQAEKDIASRLKPLLDRAETIAKQDEKRTDDYKRSIKKRLAEVASQKALSEGERLAEYILEDLLMEAAVELSNMDKEEVAENEAAFAFDRPTLESIEERLSQFQNEENLIRRKHQTLAYSQNHTSNELRKPEELFVFTTGSKPVQPLPTIGQESNKRDNRVLIDIGNGMLDNILNRRDRFERSTRKNAKQITGFDMNGFSEELLDELVVSVAKELDGTCNEMVNQVYEQEFVHTSA
uniref:Uncharacterized protein n=2 Tax=Clytia hemisphaerica TaxID=252671 RepID=A0A7M5UMU6_9CNID